MKHPELLNDDQRRAEAFIRDHEQAVIWADVGTGKTVSALTGLLALLTRFDSHRILVVGPRLVAERVWHNEVAEWSHLQGLTVSRVVGTPEQRIAALNVKADIYTITRDNVQWLESLFIRQVGTDKNGKPVLAQYRRWVFDTVVLDESQSFKSQSSQRFKSMRRLRRFFKRIYLLTGSLMPNGYKDLWAQYYLVDYGARLGKTEDAYHQRWFSKEVNDGVVSWGVKPGAAEEIDAKIADVTLVMRDANQVKPINVIKLQLDKKESQAYGRMARAKILELGGAQINAINAGVLWGKLLQLANGAVYDADRNVHVLHDKKIEGLLELLESLPRKVLIGYSYKHDVERIRAALAKAGVEGVGVLRTNQSLDDWKAGRICKGIIHPKSAGHGLNDLKDAEAVVWFGVPPDLELFDQLNGRVIGGHRLQGRQIGVHVLAMEGTVDEDAVRMLDGKDRTQTAAQMSVEAIQRLKETLLCAA